METICSATDTAGTFTFAEAAGTGEAAAVHVTANPSEAEAMQMQLCRHPAVYPEALAKHAEVIADRDLFMSTLKSFHAALGTKLSIPKIGGKDLDLHFLYKEVTSRGGLQIVIKERKWKEIALALNFPPTTTSASFVLRKFYSNSLHHYEQVYLFGVHGSVVQPPAAPAISSPAHHFSEIEHMHSASEVPEPDIRRQKIDSAQALGVDPASSIGSIVNGSIDSKFEYGYLVTVMVGTRKMKGVLYHVPPTGAKPQGASVSTFMNSLGSELKASDVEDQIGHRRRRKELSRKDPNAPRQNRSGYTFFFAEQRAKLKSSVPDKNREISKKIGDLWNRLPEEEKSPYQERGLKDKERYIREMQEYKERCRSQQEHSDGANVSQSGFQNASNESHSNNDVCNTV
ncbi:high mobility group B protein 9 [Cryptomeria japonica]|uniref:high mobility group B protein 9 n=1 Tax=Cryptomeria japonica TaxID=3369 RepID=UPI0025AD4434|nr:high mobility group B protein 9 [Cryptomeria japonica]